MFFDQCDIKDGACVPARMRCVRQANHGRTSTRCTSRSRRWPLRRSWSTPRRGRWWHTHQQGGRQNGRGGVESSKGPIR